MEYVAAMLPVLLALYHTKRRDVESLHPAGGIMRQAPHMP
jgi:hypothetical protein